MGLVCVFLAPLHTAIGQMTEEKPIERDMEVKKVNGQLEISVAFPEIFSSKLRERLSSGFTNRILIGVQLVSSQDGSSIAQGIAEYIIIYDIWEEHYVARELWPKVITAPSSFEELLAQYRVLERKAEHRNTHQISNMANLVKICGSLRRLPLTWQSAPLPEKKLTAYVRVEVNPISDEQMTKVREYLANPDGPTRQKPIFFAPTIVNWKNFQADAVVIYRSPDLPMH